jgi:hypothetical protein
MVNINETVHKAAQYLDEWYPGWAEKLEGVDYDISNCGNCVLHHVEGNYYVGLDLYKSRVSSDNWMFGNFAFCAINFDKPATHAAWDAEIQARLSKDTSANVGGGKISSVLWNTSTGRVTVEDRELVPA